MLVRYAGEAFRLPNAVSWVMVGLTHEDGTDADEGSYDVRFAEGWSPQEAIVDAERMEIPLHKTHASKRNRFRFLRRIQEEKIGIICFFFCFSPFCA